MRRSLSSKPWREAARESNLPRKSKPNVGIEGIVEESGEIWESTEVKVKEIFTEKLQMESPPAIERAHRTGKDKKPDGTPKPRTVVCTDSIVGFEGKRSDPY